MWSVKYVLMFVFRLVILGLHIGDYLRICS